MSRLKTHRCFYATRRHLFACDLCNRKFVNEQIYISHRQRHEDNVIYFPKTESNVNLVAENGKESKENDFENEKELEKNITELVMDDEQSKAEEEFNIDDEVYMKNFEDDDSDDYEDTMWDGLM